MDTTPRVSGLLTGVKELLGIQAESTEFDTQLVLYINMALETLHQLGVGPTPTYQISLTDGDIEELLPMDEGVRGLVVIYLYTKVRVLFDPPTSSFVLTALQGQITEFEWRLTNYIQESG